MDSEWKRTAAAAAVEGNQTPSKAYFQQELDKWFQSRGIIADLRSHLRHLMVMALQNTDFGPKSQTDISPKVHALNMLVAEYLSTRGCHYTLSVFASEDCQLEEMCYAFGFPSYCDTIKRLKYFYSKASDESSLMEIILQLMLEMSAKLDIQDAIGRSTELTKDKPVMSNKWTSEIADILLNENIQPSQVTSIEKSILSVTETEMKRLAGEERARHMVLLTEREKRIQEYLKKYEEDILVKLSEAEEKLTLRKDFIDGELAERQRHLFKLALEWDGRHEEIIQLSKNFYNISGENKELRKAVEELQNENKNLKFLDESQKEKINSLKEEVNELTMKCKCASESNAILNQQIQVLINNRHREISPVENITKQVTAEQKECKQADNKIDKNLGDKNWDNLKESNGIKVKLIDQSRDKKADCLGTGGSNDAVENILDIADVDYDIDDKANAPSLGWASFNQVVNSVRAKVQILEAESTRISNNYLKYKNKYSDFVPFELNSNLPTSPSLTESEDNEGNEESATSENDDSARFILKVERFSQTTGCNRPPSKPVENKKLLESLQNGVQMPPRFRDKTGDRWQSKVEIKNPTKRQQKNREYYLRNRQLMEEVEGSNACVRIEIESNSSPDSCTLSSPEVDSLGSKESQEEKSKDPSSPRGSANTPLKAASSHYNEVIQV